MILVVGGTGRLGSLVVRSLAAAGTPVRVLTRDTQRAAGLPAAIVTGDLRDAASLDAAVAGCTTVVSAAHGFVGGRHGGPEAVDRAGNFNLLRAAVAAGVDHVVLTSVHGAAPEHPMSLHRAKYAAEQALRPSGLSWTIVRATAYLETWMEIVGGKLADGGPGLVFGHGDNPINFVSVVDVAQIVVATVVDPALRAELIEVGGPENLTLRDLARRLGATRVKQIPRPALRAMSVLARPAAPAFARQARAAVVMDTTDMTFDAAPLARRFPQIAWRRLSDVLEPSAA
ncbi:MAG TPA: SDR family oxidoreductase [Jatrophihabitans sp.]|jgi:uncharacterized protein YbjT (DUF2867 family)|nr:SDR family oxidoreductase [Jatrophihabitans sp.]